MIRLALFGLGIALCSASWAGGSLNDPLDGTGIANNPNASYDPLFYGICSWHAPSNPNSAPGAAAQVWTASLSAQGDEGFSVAFGTMFGCDPSDPSVGDSQEAVDGDPLPPEQ